MDSTPHRVIDGIANSIAGGAKGLVDSVVGAGKGAAKTMMRALDTPFTQVTGKEGPHRIVDRAADGVADAGVNLVEAGIIGTAEKVGEGVMRALDQPPEQIGIPPELGKFQIFKR